MQPLITFLTLGILFLNTANSDDDLQKILYKHHKAINIGSLKSIRNINSKGIVKFFLNEDSFEKNKPSRKGTFQELIKLPEKRFFELIYGHDQYPTQIVNNDKNSWISDDGLIISKTLNKTEKILLSQQLDLIPHISYDSLNNYQLIYHGEKTIDEKKYYCIEIQYENSDKLYYYLDVKTYLVSIISLMKELPKNEEWMIRYYDEYKSISGHFFPHVLYDKMKFGNDRVVTLYSIKSITLNLTINSAVFEKPTNP